MGHLGFKSRTEHTQRYQKRQKKKGLCINCSRKAKKGYACCEYHLNYAREYARKRREQLIATPLNSKGSQEANSLNKDYVQ